MQENYDFNKTDTFIMNRRIHVHINDCSLGNWTLSRVSLFIAAPSPCAIIVIL